MSNVGLDRAPEDEAVVFQMQRLTLRLEWGLLHNSQSGESFRGLPFLWPLQFNQLPPQGFTP